MICCEAYNYSMLLELSPMKHRPSAKALQRSKFSMCKCTEWLQRCTKSFSMETRNWKPENGNEKMSTRTKRLDLQGQEDEGQAMGNEHEHK